MISKLHPEGESEGAGLTQLEGRGKGSAGGFTFIIDVQFIVDVDDLPAVLASKVEGTLAVEVIREVNAGCSWRTGGLSAVLDVLVAVGARVPWRTHALVPQSTVYAGGTILTQSCLTCVKLVLAADAGVVSGAGAVQSRAEVLTGSSIHARVTNTPLGRYLTTLAVSA